MNKWVTPVMVLFFALLFVTATSTVFQPVEAALGDIVVPDDYPTIQAAVFAATEGDVIYVTAGSYPENVKVYKPISLVGEDIDRTRIIGNWDENSLWPITITCSGVTVTGFSLVDSWVGVCIAGAHDCTISGNKILNNHFGIMLRSASGNTITANIIESAKSGACGIEATDASNNIIKANQITAIPAGIEIRDTRTFPVQEITVQNNSILDNTLTDCSGIAIGLGLTKENLLTGNTISNSNIAISCGWTENNKIYHNNFVENAKQVMAGPGPTWWKSNEVWYSIDKWDNGSEGNYWSSYTGVDANNDGIGDTPYTVSEKNTDNYPLMKPTSSEPAVNPNSLISSPTSTATPLNSEPFPTGQAIAITTSVTVAAVGLFIFFKKSAIITKGNQ